MTPTPATESRILAALGDETLSYSRLIIMLATSPDDICFDLAVLERRLIRGVIADMIQAGRLMRVGVDGVRAVGGGQA